MKYLVSLLVLISSTAFAGTYTPTVADVQHSGNLSSEKAQYYQVGSIVHVSGAVTAGSDNSSELTKISISLPVASDLGSSLDCHGTLGEADNFNVGTVSADPTNDKVIISFLASVSDMSFSQPLYINYSFDCEVIE